MIIDLLKSIGQASTRRARKLLREKKYEELKNFLEQTKRDAYLDKMLEDVQKYFTNKQEKSSTSIAEELQKDTSQDNKKNEERLKTPSSFIQFFRQKRKERLKARKNIKQSSLKMEEDKRDEKTEKLKEKTEEMSSVQKKKHELRQSINRKKRDLMLSDHLSKKQEIDKLKKEGAKAEEIKAKEFDLEQNEMKLAQNVQENLLPEIDKHMMPGLDTYIKTLSCSELSGDVYDVVSASDSEQIIYLGDVTGHGTAAGLVMTMISCLAHSIIARTSQLKDFLVTLNKELKPKLSQNMFASLIVCKWHSALRVFQYAGAGHEYILHYKAKEQKIEKIMTGGIAIGMIPDVSKIVKEQELELDNDDVVFLYTDGLDEAWDISGKERYGLDRILRDIKQAVKFTSAHDIGEYIFENIRRFQGEKERTDDMTLMVFRRVVSVDEKKLKNDFLKTSLQKDLVKNEAIIKGSSEELNPEVKKNQDDFTEKAILLAKIYYRENNYYDARDQLRAAMNISPRRSDLKEFLEEVEQKIFEENLQKGIWHTIRRGMMSFFVALKKKAINPIKEHVDNLYSEAKDALNKGFKQKAIQNLSQMKSLDEANKKIQKLEAEIAKSNEKNALEDHFSFHIPKRQEISRKAQQLIKSSSPVVGQKMNVSFKSELFREEEFVEENTSAVSSDYTPLKMLKEDDILGLKKLAQFNDLEKRLKSSEKKIEQIKDSANIEFETEIEWEKNQSVERKSKPYNKFMAKISPMNSKDLFEFIEKLTAFVKAGIPIQRSVEIIQEQAKNDGFVYVLEEIIQMLDKGSLLSQAMREFPQHFPEMLTFLVQAGEKSGALHVILNDVNEQMKEQIVVRGRIKSALIYPAVVISASLIVVVGMMVFIVPRLTKVYKDTGVDLPKVTQIVINISAYVQNNLFMMAILLIGTIAGLYFFGRTPQGKKIYHKILLYTPVFGKISRLNNIMLFSSNLSILLTNGIHISEAMTIISRIMPNYYYSQAVIRIRSRMIEKGGILSDGMDTSEARSLFSQEVFQTINAGEQTGKLGQMMKATGEMYKEHIKNTVKGLSETVEPFMIIGVGILVAVILLSVMFPLFNLGSVLRKQ